MFESGMQFSVIIPVFNRPAELDELLDSLSRQTNRQFEVIIVEDGSDQKSDAVVRKYSICLPITYIEKVNSGPGLSRNTGVQKARYDYLIFFDSDCIIPDDYIQIVNDFLTQQYYDAYGGPDKALSTFTTVQKAINYGMTSFFTTGGIRGSKKSMEKFHPRSFNLGVSKHAFNTVGGFRDMRFGEDIDFSLRLIENGFTTTLIPEAYVYHKRRTNFKKFFKQVYNSGIARINLYLLHPHSLKPVHLLPAVFVMGMIVLLVLSVFYPIFLAIPLAYCLLIFMDSTIKNRSVKVGLYSVAASWIQLVGYGTGFLSAFWNRLILKREVASAFEKNFYD